jgi:hypothetical protein
MSGTFSVAGTFAARIARAREMHMALEFLEATQLGIARGQIHQAHISGGRQQQPPEQQAPKFADAGIGKDLSSRAQKLPALASRSTFGACLTNNS